MASSPPPSSPSPLPPLPPPPLPNPPPARRLPPPCWSHDETLALIAAYRDKYHSLGRGSLRAPHWDDVSLAVARARPSPLPKTPVQCRHKVEKLRKRHRAEALRPLSPWPYFPHMDALDRGAERPVPKAVRSRAAGVRPGLGEMRRRVEERRMGMRGDGGVAAAVGEFGEGFLRMEGARMDVEREMGRMRMEMELRRTEMVLDWQRRIVETMVRRFVGE